MNWIAWVLVALFFAGGFVVGSIAAFVYIETKERESEEAETNGRL
jgi:hypothetical protein